MEKTVYRAVFVGCARDCEAHLANSMEWIESAATLFSEYKVVIVENDSVDRTKEILRSWARGNNNVKIIEQDGLSARYTLRTERIAAVRNVYLQQIRAAEYCAYDILIVLDLDGVVGSATKIAHLARAVGYLLNDDRNAGVFANSEPVYYDIWALRHKEWCPGDCWHEFNLNKSSLGQNQAMHRYIVDRQIPIASVQSPISVESAFGGLGIYRMRYIEDASYCGVTRFGHEVCEHVEFNLKIASNWNLYILPYLLVEAPIEHILVGSSGARTMVLEENNHQLALLAPGDHMLDHYRQSNPLYDRRLPLLVALISKENKEDYVIDVGSNIGDSAALMRMSGAQMPIVGVEASSFFFRFAELNKRLCSPIFSDVTFRWGLAGSTDLGRSLIVSNGTARLSGADPRDDKQAELIRVAPNLSFRDVAGGHHVSLVKIDTDGFDHLVVNNEYEFLLEEKPIIWAEAQTESRLDDDYWNELLIKLSNDWPIVAVFDNFGFGYMKGVTSEAVNSIYCFLSYCRRQRSFSDSIGGSVKTYYIDVVLFPRRFQKVAEEFFNLLPELRE